MSRTQHHVLWVWEEDPSVTPNHSITQVILLYFLLLFLNHGNGISLAVLTQLLGSNQWCSASVSKQCVIYTRITLRLENSLEGDTTCITQWLFKICLPC